MSFKVRQASIEDLKAVEHLQQQLVSYERPFDNTIPKTGEVYYYDLKKLLRSKQAKVMVVEAEGKVVGCGFGEIQKDVQWSINKNVGYIGLMYVEQNARGKGVGKMIITALLDWLKEKNMKDVRLRLYNENEDAHRAYRSYGFQDFIMEMRGTL